MTIRVAALPRAELGEAARLLAPAGGGDRLARVAEEKLFGASPDGASVALGARDGDRLVGVAAVAGSWLRILAVDPTAQRRGAGSALLEHAVGLARARGARRLRAADQPGNYWTPGVDTDDHATIEWLERRGFSRAGERESWQVGLADNPLVSPTRAAALEAALAARGYTARRAELPTRPDCSRGSRPPSPPPGPLRSGARSSPPPRACTSPHPGPTARWWPSRAYDGNNRGLGEFGPAGTAVAHRGVGLGLALLLRCLLDMATAGHAEAGIPWVSVGGFYARAVDAVPRRRFVALERELLEA